MLPRRRISLMPVIVFAALGLVAWLPLAFSSHVEAATAPRIALVTVQPGDTVWSIAEKHTAPDGDVAPVVDEIIEANHLIGASLVPGKMIRVPSGP